MDKLAKINETRLEIRISMETILDFENLGLENWKFEKVPHEINLTDKWTNERNRREWQRVGQYFEIRRKWGEERTKKRGKKEENGTKMKRADEFLWNFARYCASYPLETFLRLFSK